jgi:hypothetical protein
MGTLTQRLILQVVNPVKSQVDSVQSAVGINEDGEPIKVDDRLKLIMGQDYPMVAAGRRWPMANRALFDRLQALDKARVERGVVIDTLQAQVNNQASQPFPFDNQSVVFITHNLGRYVQATAFLPSGQAIAGGVNCPDLNTVTISFSTPQTGTLVLS